MAIAIITGATSGIGRATAIEMASRGFDLHLSARHRPALSEIKCEIDKRFESVEVRTCQIDLAQPRAGALLIEHALEQFGGVDVLINNAGFAQQVPIGKCDHYSIGLAFQVNAIAPAEAINAVWPVMCGNGGGRIINVSTLGTRDPFSGFFAYAASKCSVNSFARSIALEGSAFGIKGFAVAFGAVETPLLRSLFDEMVIPKASTLSAEEAASVIVECACGARDEENGKTIWMMKESILDC